MKVVRKNHTFSPDSLEDIKVLHTLLGLNHSKLIAVALKCLRKHVHDTAGEQLSQAYLDITKDLLSQLK